MSLHPSKDVLHFFKWGENVGLRVHLCWTRDVPDIWVQNIMARGYKMVFCTLPPPCFMLITPDKRVAVFAALDLLSLQQAHCPVSEQEKFHRYYSNFFTVPKHKWWCASHSRAQMSTCSEVSNVIHQVNDFLSSSGGFTGLGGHQGCLLAHFHFYLSIAVGEQHFQFVSLYFGLATAPKIFTKNWPLCWLPALKDASSLYLGQNFTFQPCIALS